MDGKSPNFKIYMQLAWLKAGYLFFFFRFNPEAMVFEEVFKNQCLDVKN